MCRSHSLVAAGASRTSSKVLKVAPLHKLAVKNDPEWPIVTWIIAQKWRNAKMVSLRISGARWSKFAKFLPFSNPNYPYFKVLLGGGRWGRCDERRIEISVSYRRK